MSAPAGTSLARRDRKAAFDTALDSDWSSKILAFRVRKRSTRMAFQSEFVAVIVPEHQTENTCAAGAWEMRKFCFLFWPIPPWELAVERCRDSFLAFGSLNARGVRSYRARRTEHPGLHSGRFAPHVANGRSTGRLVTRRRGDRAEPVAISEVVAGKEDRQVRARGRELASNPEVRRVDGRGDGATRRRTSRGAAERQDASEGPSIRHPRSPLTTLSPLTQQMRASSLTRARPNATTR